MSRDGTMQFEDLNREFEDYNRGSSDYPLGGNMWKLHNPRKEKEYPRQKALINGVTIIGTPETLVERINEILVQTPGYVNVTETNQQRLKALTDNSSVFPPVKAVKGEEKYRFIRNTLDGLLVLSYTGIMPNAITGIIPEETIPIKVAGKYLGIETKEINKLIKGGALKGGGGKVNLESVNKYKAALKGDGQCEVT
ncbi:hypothetical protein HYU14_06240 [Candidatus Woesearchaeota archaeon]|nr:hypothetical protein [Candidatus Woesearchaeota archaeon]